MSIPIIRKALELHLAALAPGIATAFENVAFTPITGTPYQRVKLLPNTPDNSIQGSSTYFERGLFQVTLCYPIDTGPAASDAQAQLTRTHFKRGATMLNSDITVIVMETPRVSPAMDDDDRYCIAVTVPWQAQITT